MVTPITVQDVVKAEHNFFLMAVKKAGITKWSFNNCKLTPKMGKNVGACKYKFNYKTKGITKHCEGTLYVLIQAGAKNQWYVDTKGCKTISNKS